MKTLLAIFLNLILLMVPSPAFAQNETNLAGNWLATLDVSGVELRLLLKIQNTGNGYTAKFDSVDQAVKDLPVDSVTLNGNKMNFVAAQFGMSYEGTLNDKGEEITGTFKQGAGSAPMIFRRVGDVPMITRRQDPKKPYPYNEEEVSYRNVKDNVKLAGTLSLPRNGNRTHPAVILISGSGPQNRDSLIAGHRPFLVLSDHLTRQGIAVLRVDDRGTGDSDLGSLAATSETFMGDVLAGVEFLKTRKEINPKRIGLIGHSEGGMIAPMAAARSKDVAFIVLLAGPGQRGEDVVTTQTELMQRVQGTDADTIAQGTSLLNKIHTIVKTENDENRREQLVKEEIARHVGTMNETQRKAFAPLESSLRTLMPMFRLPWFRYFITFEPAEVLRRVKVPVLALNGELDLQVAWKENLDRIAAALKQGKNKDYGVKAFPRLNHLFQTSTTGLPSEYGKIEETMSPEVLKTISEWIIKRAR
ncbi:MAG: alpha/beta hydrolase family protein [Acidobacteriota bacterium]